MKIYNVSEPIVNYYINLIENEKRTLIEVPERFREEILRIFKSDTESSNE